MIPIAYFILNILHALYHWYLADKKNITIKSKRKTAEYLLICLVATIVLGIIKWQLLPLVVFPVITRAAVFDIALNKFRGKKWTYEGEISWKKSGVDWIEWKIGLPTWAYRLIYLIGYITYLIFYLT